LRTFRHGSNYTLWLAPEPNEPLVALQTSLWRVVPDCDDTQRHTNGFTPHLSIGQVRGHGARGRLTAELQAAWMPVRFSISDVQLIWRGDPPDDVFQIGERIVLGHSSAPSV
jgi:2'-5' RNA ligase